MARARRRDEDKDGTVAVTLAWGGRHGRPARSCRRHGTVCVVVGALKWVCRDVGALYSQLLGNTATLGVLA